MKRSDLNTALEIFISKIREKIEHQIITIMIYGSAVYNDLSPGYGDLDFLVITKENLSDAICSELIEVRKLLKSGNHGELVEMLEGAFLPIPMLNKNNSGQGLWWGTSGERKIEKSNLGSFTPYVIKQDGIIIYGIDVKDSLIVPCEEELIDEILEFSKVVKKHGRGGELHSIDWLLMISRYLYWLRENKTTSKTHAALWASENAYGQWKESLQVALQLRKMPKLAKNKEYMKWLTNLTETIGSACLELDEELTKKKRLEV